MIESFNCKETKKVFAGRFSRKLPGDIQGIAKRKLNMIASATDLNDLRVPPSNRLERLSGNRSGQYSIRVNDQWRICFTLSGGGFANVEITDYH